MKQVRGVEKTRVGYANSALSDPSYEQVCSGATGAAETVEVVYDPAVVGLPLLLNLYFLTIDPTSLNRQGGDIGTQYRTGIYYTDTADLPFIREALSRTERSYDEPLVVEIGPLENFYPAEKYHQDYLDKILVGIATSIPDFSMWRVGRIRRMPGSPSLDTSNPTRLFCVPRLHPGNMP